MAEPAKPNLSNFGTWHEGVCPACSRLKLVIGELNDIQKCRKCWFFPPEYVRAKKKEEPRVPTAGMRRTPRRKS